MHVLVAVNNYPKEMVMERVDSVTVMEYLLSPKEVTFATILEFIQMLCHITVVETELPAYPEVQLMRHAQ